MRKKSTRSSRPRGRRLPQRKTRCQRTDRNKMHNTEIPSSPNQVFAILPEEAGQRLDRYLVAVLAERSRTHIQQLIAADAIQVNGRASKPGYVVRVGDEIQIDLAPTLLQTSKAKPNELPVDIVYEDEDLLVVNKAPGMVVHPAPGHNDDTLVNALLAYYPELQASTGTDQRPGIVHLIHRDTS